MVKIQRLPSGSYRARVHLGDGKYKSITGKDKKEVQFKAAQLEAQAEIKKTDSDESRLTLGEAMQKYIQIKSNVLSPATIRGYDVIQRTRLQAIKDVPLYQITPELIQRTMNEEAANLSPKTCRNIHGFLSAVLSMYAPELKLNTTLPKQNKTEIKIPDEEVVKQLIDYFADTEMELPFMLAAFCGLRESEIAGLKWENVNLETNRITINTAVVANKDFEYVEKKPKSYAGERVIRIYPFVREVLLKSEQRTGRVTTLTGHTMYNRLRAALKALGLSQFRFHDLRHYCVSVMLSLNIPKKYIIDYIGHADENMVDRVYGHIMATKKSDVEDIMQDYFESKVLKSDTKSDTNK